MTELAAAPATAEHSTRPLVRPATHDDVPACLVLSRHFFDESGMAKVTGFDTDCAEAMLRHLIDDSACELFVAGTQALIGIAGVMTYPMYFNTSHLAAQELFWWVDPAHRGGTAGVRMLLTMEQWARDRGCKTLTMVCLPIDSPAERIYERMGYAPSERSFIRSL